MEKKAKKKRTRTKGKSHYINNKDFYKAICEHLDKVNAARENDEPPPQVSEYIGLCILQIANKLANRSNFANYPFREELISDAIVNCLLYIDRFNPEYKNPFAYYTQVAWNAFIQRIEKEHTNLYTKYKQIEDKLLYDIHDEDKIHITKYGTDYSDEMMREFMDKFETKKAAKKRKISKKKASKETKLEV
jgi:hypothetical protein